MANAQGSENISQVVGEKLDNNNFTLWKFRMKNFLVGRGYWDLCTGDESEPKMDSPPSQEQRTAHKHWTERACKVLHWISLSISDAMVIQITSCESPKDAWDILMRNYGNVTHARKIQLKQQFNNLSRGSRSILVYTTEVKTIADQLATIDAGVEEDDMIAVTLNGLGKEYKPFDTSISVRAEFPSWDELVALLLHEEVKLGLNTGSGMSQGRDTVLYSNQRGRGHRDRGSFRGRGDARNMQNQQNNWRVQGQRGSGTYKGAGRATRGGYGSGQSSDHSNRDKECYYCGKVGHIAKDCYKQQADKEAKGKQHSNYASSSNTANDQENRLFSMQHLSEHDEQNDERWYIDSGASNHMTPHGEWFNRMDAGSHGYVCTGDDTQHDIKHRGSVPLRMLNGQQKSLQDVLHVPTITKNLLSVGQMAEQNLQVRFNKDGCFVEEYDRGHKLIAKGSRNGRMFTLDASIPELNAAMFSNDASVIRDVEIWHKRIGHVNIEKLKSMQQKNVVEGLPKFKYVDLGHVCSACQFGKQSRFPFVRHVQNSSRPLQLIHSDVWGPSQNASFGGAHYYVSFIDDFSRYTWLYILKHKDEVFESFKDFKKHAENEFSCSISCLRSDGGGEYVSNEFDRYLANHGIRRQLNCRYTPQQNGVAERKNRVVMETARAMLNEKCLPNVYWAEAVMTAVYVLNRTPTAGIHDATPFEMLYGYKPDIRHLKVFGCIAYVHVPDEKRRKLDPKAVKSVFLGYARDRKAYKCYVPSTHETLISRDVVFDELASWYGNSSAVLYDEPTGESTEKSILAKSEDVTNGGSPKVSPWSGRLRNSQSKSTDPSMSVSKRVESSKARNEGYESSGSENLDSEFGIPSVVTPGAKEQRYVPPHTRQVQSEQKPRRSERVRKPIDRYTCTGYNAQHYAYMTKVTACKEPTKFAEAVIDDKWCEAMDEEYSALVENGTWDLVKLPDGKVPIGSKWVYKLKFKSDGTLERYKARLVAKGYAQQYGLDYEETFSPVAKMATVRTVIALAAAKGWKLWQMDVKNAFLNGELQEEVYMEQPEGYVHQKFPTHVCKLTKALYGLKQAPRAWNARITSYLKEQGFVIGEADHSLFVKQTEVGQVWIVVYVDDLIITGDDADGIADVKVNLQKEFKVKDLGELRYFLGIEVVYTPQGIWLLQKQYAKDMLQKYGMADCKAMDTPLEQNVKLQMDIGTELEDVTMYRQMVGSLIYLTITRPDLSYAVGLISQFMQKPRKPHLDAVRRIMRYVKGTTEFGLFYEDGTHLELTGYTDADWAGSAYDRRSTSGYAFSLGNSMISWQSKKQPTVALSSTEAEYRGAALAACEVAWLQKLLHDLGSSLNNKVTIYCDNMSSMMLATNPVFHARSKHIEVHYHFIREMVLSAKIDLQHVKTEDQVADIFTKSLGRDKFLHFRELLGVLQIV